MNSSNNSFSEMNIAPCFIKRLEERNIVTPTDIQKKIIPRLSSRQNVFFSSATGTGKTFAYLLPILSSLTGNISQGNKESERKLNTKTRKSQDTAPRFVIIAPTLELSAQIKTEIDFLLESGSDEVSGGMNLKSSLVIGSAGIDSQIEELKRINPDIITGNLSRLLMLSKMGKIKFSSLEFLVFDEADRLVSGEMLDDTCELCEIIRHGAQKSESDFIFAACSATINEKCREKLLSNCFGRDTDDLDKINIIESDNNEILREKIEHWAIFSEKRRKDQTLRSLLAALNGSAQEGGQISRKSKKTKIKALIFTSRNDEALFVLSRLQHHHVSAAGLFGKAGKKAVSGENRKEALDLFREEKVTALVSTDLAARGLDIQGITHVIALDVPSDKEVYIHRCGRTARAGKTGVMVTIGDETQMRLLSSLEKKLKIKIYPKELRYGQICAPLI